MTLNDERLKAADELAAAIKEKVSEREAIGKVADALKEEAKLLKIVEDKMRQELCEILGYIPTDTEHYEITFDTAESVEILDRSAIPDEYFRVRKEPSKTAIGDAIRAGKQVGGAALATHKYAVIKGKP